MSSGYLHQRTKDYGKLPALLMHDKDITDGAKLLYGHMHWRYVNANGNKNQESQGSMAELLGVTEKTISNRIKELESKHWIVTIERGYDAKTGKYQTPYYHVFEVQADCGKFRADYVPAEGERISPFPEKLRERASRKGKGGNPRLRNLSSDGENPQNSSSDGGTSEFNPRNSSSAVPQNSSSDYKTIKDSKHQEQREEEKESSSLPSEPTKVIPFAEPAPRADLRTAVETTLKLKGAAYSMVEKYVNFFTGQTPETTTPKDKKKPVHNGKWFEYQITPGMDETEILALHDFIATRYSFLTLGACTLETISRYVALFRNDKDHAYFVERIANSLPAIRAKLRGDPLPMWEPEPMPIAAGAEADAFLALPPDERKAAAEAMLKRLSEKWGGKA